MAANITALAGALLTQLPQCIVRGVTEVSGVFRLIASY